MDPTTFRWVFYPPFKAGPGEYEIASDLLGGPKKFVKKMVVAGSDLWNYTCFFFPGKMGGCFTQVEMWWFWGVKKWGEIPKDGGFMWIYPTGFSHGGFPTKSDDQHLACEFWGYHHWRKHPNSDLWPKTNQHRFSHRAFRVSVRPRVAKLMVCNILSNLSDILSDGDPRIAFQTIVRMSIHSAHPSTISWNVRRVLFHVIFLSDEGMVANTNNQG